MSANSGGSEGGGGQAGALGALSLSARSLFKDECFGITVKAAAVALAWLALVKSSKALKVLPSTDARKLLHVGIGLLFCLTWAWYPAAAPAARLWASAIPASITAAVGAAGAGLYSDRHLVEAMSRSGDPAELLTGPLVYGAVHWLAAAAFWLDSPVGVVAIAALCAGDGFADIVGRRLGRSASARLPWNADKSYAGTAAFVLFSFVAASGLLAWHDMLAAVPAPALLAVCAGSAAVESLPYFGEYDNAAVFATAVALGSTLL